MVYFFFSALTVVVHVVFWRVKLVSGSFLLIRSLQVLMFSVFWCSFLEKVLKNRLGIKWTFPFWDTTSPPNLLFIRRNFKPLLGDLPRQLSPPWNPPRPLWLVTFAAAALPCRRFLWRNIQRAWAEKEGKTSVCIVVCVIVFFSLTLFNLFHLLSNILAFFASCFACLPPNERKKMATWLPVKRNSCLESLFCEPKPSPAEDCPGGPSSSGGLLGLDSPRWDHSTIAEHRPWHHHPALVRDRRAKYRKSSLVSWCGFWSAG